MTNETYQIIVRAMTLAIYIIYSYHVGRNDGKHNRHWGYGLFYAAALVAISALLGIGV